MRNDIFTKLFDVIQQRKGTDPDTSYVSKLMHKGTDKICSKIIEEAGETIEAAGKNDKEHLIYEVCDLIFHTFVLCGYKDISLTEIESELGRRFGISGITEKQNRKKK